VTPILDDKALLEHAAHKAAAIVRDNLSGIDSGFNVRLLTADDFPSERLRLGEQVSLGLSIRPADPAAIAEFSPAPPLSIQNLERKVSRLTGTDTEQLKRTRNDFVGQYIDAQSLELQLHERYPAFYDKWRTARGQVSRTLGIAHARANGSANSLVDSIAKTVCVAARESIPSLEAPYIDTLAFGAIAEWLLECPLDLQVSPAVVQ
jgi:hypothetical protein